MTAADYARHGIEVAGPEPSPWDNVTGQMCDFGDDMLVLGSAS